MRSWLFPTDGLVGSPVIWESQMPFVSRGYGAKIIPHVKKVNIVGQNLPFDQTENLIVNHKLQYI